MDLFTKNSSLDPPLIAFEIPKLLDRVISVVPNDSIDYRWASGMYEANKDKKQYDNEFVQITENQLTLISETNLSIKNAHPKALLYYQYNHLFPLYSLTLWWLIDQKNTVSFRTFLFFDSKELELFLSKKTRIILLRKERIEVVIHLDMPSVDKKIWDLQNPDRPIEYVKDKIAAKAWVESCINKKPTTQQKLEFGWANRLNREVSSVINFYHDPQFADQIKKERELLKSSSSMYLSEEFPSIAAYNYTAYSVLFMEREDPIKLVTNLKGELADTPLHFNFIRKIIGCAWFSLYGTYRGQALRSVELDGNVKLLKLDPLRLGDCINHYWDRIDFDLPLYHEQLLGSNGCGIDIEKFISKAPLYQGDIQKGEEFVKNVLAEATSLKQWTIPFGAYVQLDIGEIKAVKLFEIGQDVACVLVDQSGHYLLIWVNPSLQNIVFTNRGDIAEACGKYERAKCKGDVENKKWHELQRRLQLAIEVLIASIIRDFWVVEERERVFGKSVVTKKMSRLKSDWQKKTIVYLPRVRYIGDIRDGSKGLDLVARSPHFVTGHLRKALKASESQILIARQYGIVVPEGFTFVKPHRRGDKAQEKIYRSRSALQCVQALKTFPVDTDRDAWFQYELNVKNWLLDNGYEVEHLAASRNGDGGVDIQAYKQDEHLLVQCKYWQIVKIGPDKIREMLGTLQTFPKGSRGVIITSTELTEGAKKLAIENDVQFIENVDFSVSLRYKTATIL